MEKSCRYVNILPEKFPKTLICLNVQQYWMYWCLLNPAYLSSSRLRYFVISFLFLSSSLFPKVRTSNLVHTFSFSCSPCVYLPNFFLPFQVCCCCCYFYFLWYSGKFPQSEVQQFRTEFTVCTYISYNVDTVSLHDSM